MIRFNALVIEPQPNEGLLDVLWIAYFGCSAANPVDQQQRNGLNPTVTR